MESATGLKTGHLGSQRVREKRDLYTNNEDIHFLEGKLAVCMQRPVYGRFTQTVKINLKQYKCLVNQGLVKL